MNQTAVLFPSPPLQPHAKKIARYSSTRSRLPLASALNNPQQLSHRGDLLQLLLNEPLKEIVRRIVGLSLCHGQKRIYLGCYVLFLFERKLYRVFSDFEVRLGRRHSRNVHTGTGVDDELDETQRVRFFFLGL